ncbi:MAG: hypothetical protein OIF58_11095 [Cohaesibacter sp.]|nr:hypothetical protein [Cohaesibacter sp.]
MFNAKLTGKQKAFKQLRKVAPSVVEDLGKGLQTNATEMASMARDFAPKDSGDYSETIKAKEVEDKAGVPIWAVFASWIWPFVEFGTRAGRRGERINQNGRSRKVQRNHPGTSAQPHLWPAYRTIKKRLKGRTTRSLNKAVKKAIKG